MGEYIWPYVGLPEVSGHTSGHADRAAVRKRYPDNDLVGI